jgi:NAD(P)-dependent dehydrogenase (short-subunit alcohol dehydrogenase family)
MSSNVVRAPPPVTFAHYVTSKAAVVGITRSSARELGPHGITVNTILPGATETVVSRVPEIIENRKKHVIPGQCIPRQEMPEDLLSTAYFLATDERGFITGQCLAVDGGFTFT